MASQLGTVPSVCPLTSLSITMLMRMNFLMLYMCKIKLNWDSFSQKLFNPFDFNDSDNDIPLIDADPDLHFYNEIFGSFSAICNYYQDDSFNVMSQKNVAANYQCPLSLCHINIRSINRNFQSFQQYLAVLNFKFAAIGVSETWLTE